MKGGCWLMATTEWADSSQTAFNWHLYPGPQANCDFAVYTSVVSLLVSLVASFITLIRVIRIRKDKHPGLVYRYTVVCIFGNG